MPRNGSPLRPAFCAAQFACARRSRRASPMAAVVALVGRRCRWKSGRSLLPTMPLLVRNSRSSKQSRAAAAGAMQHAPEFLSRKDADGKCRARPVLGAPRPVARMPRTGGTGAELLRTLSSGVGAPDGVGESLLRTLSSSRRAATGGDEPEGMELTALVGPEPEPEPEPESMYGQAHISSSLLPRDTSDGALVAVTAAPVGIDSTVVLAASEYRPHPAFELAEKIPTESIDLTDNILGQGRFGVVREGLMADVHGRRVRVAVKMLVGVKPGEASVFEQEIRVLQHVAGKCSNVCRLYGTCWLEKSLCIVMKQYSMSLDKLMDSSPDRKLPLRRSVQLMSQILVGLAELHEQRVIVHDLKPSNVLLDEYGQPVIADFGVSTVCETQSVYMPTHAGAMKGTFNYMCAEAFDPEQFGGITSAADLWSVGCSLLEMLTGKVPWVGIAQPVIMSRVLIKREHPPIEAHIPPALQAILRKCFASTAAERPTARALVQELQNLQDSLPAEAETRLTEVERRKIEWVRQDLGMTGLSSDRPITEAEEMSFARAVADKLGFSPRGPANATVVSVRDTLLRAEGMILQQTMDLSLSESNPFRGGFFLSHNQGKSGPAVMRLKGRMEVACPKLKGKLWYDKDNIPTEDEMRLGIKRCTFFLLFLSAEVLLRPFVRKEIRWAVHYRKKIVLVWEQEGANAVGAFGTFFEDCAKEVSGSNLNDIIGDLFGQNVAIPYFTDEEFGAVSLAQILREGGYNSEANALLAPRPISMPAWVRANFVYCPSNGEGQTMSIKNELEELCPPLWGRLVTQEELDAEHHLVIFVTSGAFADGAVQRAASSALAGGNAVTMIVETDDRHGGAAMEDIKSVPSKLLIDAPADALQLAQVCTVVPFYKDRAYRRVALAKVLQSLEQTDLQQRAAPLAISGAKYRLTPKVVVIIITFMLVLVIALIATVFSRGDDMTTTRPGCGHDTDVQALLHVAHRCDSEGKTVPSGTQCSINCMEGYRADQQHSLQQNMRSCKDGVWTGLLPNCKADACESIDLPTGSSTKCVGKTGDECTLECNRGYEIAGSSVLTCGADHVFRGHGSCEDIDECETSNGGCADLEICKNAPGSHSCQTCVHGFTRGPEVNSTAACSPRCVASGTGLSERCSFPFSYAGRTYNDCTTEQLPHNLPEGSSWCATGPNPSDYRQCVECSTVLECPVLIAPSFGQFTCAPHRNAFGSSCDLRCDDGYGYGGPIKYECEWTETWSPANSTSACIDRCTDTGALCQFPFRLNGQQYNDCTEDQGPKGTEGSLWCATGDDARTQYAKCVPCQDVDCGELEGGSAMWEHNHYTAHCNSSLYFDYGTCQAECDAGYQGTRRTMVATCGKEYSWHWAHDDHVQSGEPPDCERCRAGTFAGVGSTTCTQCPPGRFANSEGASGCTQCTTQPCRACLDTSSPHCACDSGYVPHSSESQMCTYNPCAHETCSSHGACYVSPPACPTCTATANCDCDEGWSTGPTSSRQCAVNLCDHEDCSHHGTCSVEGGVAKCTCAPGYSGKQCIVDLCASLDCGSHGTCHQSAGKASCMCSENYSGDRCQFDTCQGRSGATTKCEVPNHPEYTAGTCSGGACQMLCQRSPGAACTTTHYGKTYRGKCATSGQKDEYSSSAHGKCCGYRTLDSVQDYFCAPDTGPSTSGTGEACTTYAMGCPIPAGAVMQVSGLAGAAAVSNQGVIADYNGYYRLGSTSMDRGTAKAGFIGTFWSNMDHEGYFIYAQTDYHLGSNKQTGWMIGHKWSYTCDTCVACMCSVTTSSHQPPTSGWQGCLGSTACSHMRLNFVGSSRPPPPPSSRRPPPPPSSGPKTCDQATTCDECIAAVDPTGIFSSDCMWVDQAYHVFGQCGVQKANYCTGSWQCGTLLSKSTPSSLCRAFESDRGNGCTSTCQRNKGCTACCGNDC